MTLRRCLTFCSALLAVPVVLRTEDVRSLPEYAKARDVARQVLEDSRDLLLREVAAKGPAGAVDACAAVALDIGRRREGEGWRVRRVSTKLRNPADAPDAYEAAVLTGFAEKPVTAETEHAGISLEEGRRYVRYIRPIVIQGELCLRCHGDPDSMDPKVAEALRRRYPGDKATGYKVGDLRGAVSIRIPLSR